PVLEERLDLAARRERRVMVEVDVKQDRDLRPQGAHRSVRLVALDDEPAGAGPSVAAPSPCETAHPAAAAGFPPVRGHAPAEEEGRVEAEPVEAEGDHRARR